MNKRTTFLSSVFVIALVTAPVATPALADNYDHKNEKTPHAKQTEGSDISRASKIRKKDHDDKHVHVEGEQDHHEDGKHHDDEHAEHSEHGDGKGHAHHAKNVGPQRGITSLDEEGGFTLSVEALKTFSIETMKLTGTGPWTVPVSVLLLAGEEKSIYRIQKTRFKRINIKLVNKKKSHVVIESEELESGDQVVTSGVGNLRIAEIDATSGESGHHH